MGLISEKPEALYAELNKRGESATSRYSVTGDFLQYIYSVPETKNPQNIRSTCLVHEFFLNDIMVTEKLFMAASVLYVCGYLFLL